MFVPAKVPAVSGQRLMRHCDCERERDQQTRCIVLKVVRKVEDCDRSFGSKVQDLTTQLLMSSSNSPFCFYLQSNLKCESQFSESPRLPSHLLLPFVQTTAGSSTGQFLPRPSPPPLPLESSTIPETVIPSSLAPQRFSGETIPSEESTAQGELRPAGSLAKRTLLVLASFSIHCSFVRCLLRLECRAARGVGSGGVVGGGTEKVQVGI